MQLPVSSMLLGGDNLVFSIWDAELSVESTVIAAKVKRMEKQLRAYSVNGQPVLGLVVGSKLMLYAIRIEGGVISV